MYKIVCKLEDVMVVLILAVFCCLIGQWAETFWPDNLVLTMLFFLFACVGVSCYFYRMIYDKGWNAAQIEQEPDEDNRRDSTT